MRKMRGKTEGFFLTAFDEELNQIGETLVPQLTKKPERHFAKDWEDLDFMNKWNDEMGFVRLEMKVNSILALFYSFWVREHVVVKFGFKPSTDKKVWLKPMIVVKPQIALQLKQEAIETKGTQ